MFRLTNILLIFFSLVYSGYSQIDEIWLEPDVTTEIDSTSTVFVYSVEQVEEYMQKHTYRQGEFLLGGSVGNIFHESVDSVKILVRIDGEITDSLITEQGLFCIALSGEGRLVDLSLSHPDYHPKDTTLLLPGTEKNILFLFLEPRYKILLRGRVYAGNMPMEGVDVNVKHAGNSYNLVTKGCFYDKEGYWNCLFDGMFKLNLTTENPSDSVHIFLSKRGMKPYESGMTFREYSGEIMDLKMKYESSLPVIAHNSLNFKLSFPILSSDDDWFVSLSFYRLLNTSRLKRIAYGIDANMYITTVSVLHNTFRGLEPSKSDSSYIDAFIGPSVLYWFITPEKRFFSTYGGCTFAYNVNKPALVFQPFIGSRLFIDLNKSISLEIRYSEYKTDIIQYRFNPYGTASRYSVEDTFDKLHANLGVQIVF